MSDSTKQFNQAPFRLGRIKVDPLHCEVVIPGNELPTRLEPRAMQVLLELANADGQFVSRDDLISRVWGDRVVTDDSLTGAVRSIRQVLGDDPRSPRFIETRKQVGYRLLLRPRTKQSPNYTLAFALTAAAALVLTFVVWATFDTRSPDSPGKTIAVLPFENLRPGVNDYLGTVISDALIMRMGQQPGVKVFSRQSTMGFSDPDGLRRAARELGPDLLVTGTVVSDHNQIRVNVRLIEPQSLTQVWAHQFDSPLGNALGLQNDLGNAIAAQIGVAVSGETGSEILPPQDMQDLLRARYLVSRGSTAELTAAEQIFSRLTKKHPQSAMAWQGLSEVTLELVKDYALRPEALTNALYAALLAEKLGGESPSLDRLIGQIELFHNYDYEESERRYIRALAANPSDAVAQRRYAWLLVAQKRFDEAEKMWAATKLLDPATYTSAEIAFLRLYSGRTADAARDFERLAREPEVSNATLRGQYVAYRLLSDPRATETLRKLVAQSLPVAEEMLLELGEQALLMKMLEDDGYRSRVAGAGYAALIGNDTKALDMLAQAVKERDPFTIYLASIPELRGLHHHPRFSRLLAGIGQPSSHLAVATAH